MVARGDLGVEVGDAQLIGIQKDLITRARKMDRVVITATQMMESMISSPMPGVRGRSVREGLAGAGCPPVVMSNMSRARLPTVTVTVLVFCIPL